MKYEEIQKRITLVLHGVSIFLFATIFFGFFVQNLYLSLFGFSDFNFLRVTYISAGILFGVFVAVPIMAFRFNNELVKSKWKHFFSRIGTFFIILIFFAFFVRFNTPGLSGFIILVPFSLLWILMVRATENTLVTLYTQFSDRKKLQEINSIFRKFGKTTHSLVGVFLIFFLLAMFSASFYPFIPKYIGGGEPVRIEISLRVTMQNRDLLLQKNPINAFLVYQKPESLLINVGDDVYYLNQSDIAYIKYSQPAKEIGNIIRMTGHN